MKLEKHKPIFVMVLLAFALAAPMVYASELNPGDTAPPDMLTPGGSLLNSITGQITTPTFTTNYTEWVYMDPGNLFCTNCLDFVYQFANVGPDANERFTSSSFNGFRVDAGFEPGTGINLPLTVSRSTDGAVVSFNYTGNHTLAPGQSTAILVIETNATGYGDGFVSAQDGTAGSAAGFAPVATVPEPASIGLLGTGILLVGRALARRAR